MMTAWENFFKEKMNELAQADIVHDIGGGADPQARENFKKYVLVDVDPAYHPDIVADIHRLPFEDNSLEAVLCLSVLEHVENPFVAVQELRRVLRPGGKILLSVPFIWPYHASKHYKDYWRFSKDGLELLLKSFSHTEIVKCGGYFSTLVNFIPYFFRLDKVSQPLAKRLDLLLAKRGGNSTSSYYAFVVK